jgi:CHAD domain-containing protein
MGKDHVGARKYMFVTNGIVDISQHWDGDFTHELRVHIQKLKGELETFRKLLSKVFQPTCMDNRLKEFE